MLKILDKNKLYLKSEKYKFKKSKIEYFSIIIREEKIKIDSTKLAAINKWPASRIVKETQSFLRFYNLYQKFIENLHLLLNLYTNLLEKIKTFTKSRIATNYLTL